MFAAIVPVLRFSLLWLSISVPLAIPGHLLFGQWGAIVSGILVLVFLLALGLWAELIIIKGHRGRLETPIGLRKTLHRVLEQQNQQKAPRLMIYPDPSPNALCIRGLWSRGTIMVSQGMTALLDEQELRYVLHECLRRCKDSNLLISTICGVLASLTLGSAPRPWVNTALLGGVLAGLAPSPWRSKSKHPGGGMTPLAAFRFLIFYPFVRLLLFLGRRVERAQSEKDTDLGRVNATHKLKGVWDYIAKPEYLHLYLLHTTR